MGIENLLLGFHVAITPYNLFVAVVGITLGTIIGVLPGLGGANGVAILLPLTFTMPPTSAIILLTSLYTGFYMRWIGRHTWLAVLAVAILFPLATFFVFEKWFLVPMPKGPFEAWLGQ